MTFVPIDKLPKNRRNRTKCKNQARFEEFMNMEIAFAKIELSEGEYGSINIACATLNKSAKRFGVPVKAHKINNELYFVRTDM